MYRFTKVMTSGVFAVLFSGGMVSHAAELAAGTVIEKANIDKVKNDTFDGHTIASLLTEKLEWQIRNTGLRIPLGHAKPVQLDPKYIEATTKNAGKAQFDEKTREVTGWTAGIPFPKVDQNDPHAGEKLLWNFYYASPEGDAINNKVTFLLISGDKGLESTQEWVFQRYYMKGRIGGDQPVLGDGSILSKTLYAATSPEDIRGVGTFTIRYDDPKFEDSWAYIKSARRVRRLSGGAWMDPVGGLDQLSDDAYVWNARPSWYPKIKLLGRRWILAISDAKLGYTPSKKGTPEEWATVDLKNPPYWNPVQTWQPREVWVIEGTPPTEHPYGRKVAYMDVNYPRIYTGEVYDKKGEFWRFINFHMTPSVGVDGTKYSSSIQGDYIDFKARHASIFLFRSYKLNERNPKAEDVNFSALESIAR